MSHNIKVLKALADENRLNIVDILSCGELCVCDIMLGLNLTQPTVSHHLKILQTAGLINYRKEGKWRFFSLKREMFSEILNYITIISSEKEECICLKSKTNCK